MMMKMDNSLPPTLDELNGSDNNNLDTASNSSIPAGNATKRTKSAYRPVWSTWRRYVSVKLWAAVALASDINPHKLQAVQKYQPEKYQKFRRRLKKAVSWLGTDLKVVEHPDKGTTGEEQMVSLISFVRCAESKNIRVSKTLSEMVGTAVYDSLSSSAEATTTSSENTTSTISASDAKMQEMRIVGNTGRSKELDERYQELQDDANEVAERLKAKNGYPPSKQVVVNDLHKQAKWRNREVGTLMRNIRVTWRRR